MSTPLPPGVAIRAIRGSPCSRRAQSEQDTNDHYAHTHRDAQRVQVEDEAALHSLAEGTARPGEDFSVPLGAQIEGLQREGSDRFGTWVILWHPGLQQARFLGSWTWTVDYNDPTGTRLQVSQLTSLLGTGGAPADAVLLGNRCRDVLVSTQATPRRETLADTQAFQDAARNDQTRAAFDQAEQGFVAAVPGRDAGTLRAMRDNLLTSWRALSPTEQKARRGRLVVQLRKFEQTVNHRIPSDAALLDQYRVQI